MQQNESVYLSTTEGYAEFVSQKQVMVEFLLCRFRYFAIFWFEIVGIGWKSALFVQLPANPRSSRKNAFEPDTGRFAMALIRLMVTKGAPRQIYIDNGNKFVGHVKEMKKRCKMLWQGESWRRPIGERSPRAVWPPSFCHQGGVLEPLFRTFYKMPIVLKAD